MLVVSQMKTSAKPIPEFATEAKERAFWESPANNSIEYVDWSEAKAVSFPNLKPTSTRDRGTAFAANAQTGLDLAGGFSHIDREGPE